MVENKKSFDYTSMADFLYCRRMYDLRHNKGWKINKPATALSFGGAIGKALDSWYTDKEVDKAIQIFKENYTEDTEDDKRTYRLGEWILKNYDKRYQDQPWKLISRELEFSVPLPNGNNLIGRIDKVVDWNGAVWGVDHKTTSQLGPQFFNFSEPNLQFMGYSYALIAKGYDVKGFVVDAILVAKGLIPQTSSLGKPIPPSTSLTPLARYDIYHKPEHIAEWLDSVQKIQADIKQCEETNTWYPNFTSCVGKYGDCQFRKVCKEEEKYRQKILEMDYTIEFWNPLSINQDSN